MHLTEKFNYFIDSVFADGKYEYAGQAISLVVAETRYIAIAAVKLVEALQNADVVGWGRLKMGAQYHFNIWIHVFITKLTDDGLGLEPPTVSDVALQLNYDDLDLNFLLLLEYEKCVIINNH